MKNRAAVVVISVVLAFFALAVWPTRWRYDQVQRSSVTLMLRTDRLSGRVERLTDRGWLPLASASGELPAGVSANDPYAEAFRGLK